MSDQDDEEHPQARVLVVEDDGPLRLVATEALTAEGFDVVEAETADQAVVVLEADMTIELVFSDVQMPGTLNGLDLVLWLRRARPEVKVILTSGNTALLEGPIGASACLRKPYQIDRLAVEVRKAMASANLDQEQ